MAWFWRFTGFGFLGFLLEAAHAHFLGDRSERKCLLFLPLCPVYGLGGWVCALLKPAADLLSGRLFPLDSLSAGSLSAGSPGVPLSGLLLMFLLGALGCTAAEYAMGAWYEWCAGVPFWDYGNRTGSIRGRVCLCYSALWGLLSVAASLVVLPVLDRLAAAVPPPVTVVCGLLVTADLTASHILLRRTRDRSCLRRYGFPRRRGRTDESRRSPYSAKNLQMIRPGRYETGRGGAYFPCIPSTEEDTHGKEDHGERPVLRRHGGVPAGGGRGNVAASASRKGAGDAERVAPGDGGPVRAPRRIARQSGGRQTGRRTGREAGPVRRNGRRGGERGGKRRGVHPQGRRGVRRGDPVGKRGSGPIRQGV